MNMRKIAPCAGWCLLAAPLVWGSQNISTAVELDPPIECWYQDAFPQLDARLVPQQPVEQARLYFRCSLYPDYYFVNLETSATGYRGVGPIAEETCPRVHYYVETLTVDYSAARSEERIADVTSHGECRRRFPAAAVYPGDPDLFIGSTTAGAPSMAPGFKVGGVKGFVSAVTGQVATSGGSGISPAAAVGIGAAGAGAVIAIAGGTSADEEASSTAPAGTSDPAAVSTPPPATTISVPPTTPSAPHSVRACFDVDPPEAIIDAGASVRLDGRCSTGSNLTYRWDLGDGRAPRDGAFITPIYSRPGVFTVTLTVSEATTSFALASDSLSKTITVREPPPALTACFTASPTAGGPDCEMRFDATCSVGDIVRYDWVLDQGNTMGAGPYPDTGVIVLHNWQGYPGCNTFPPWTPISVLLTVTARDGSKASTALTVDVEKLRQTSFTDGDAARETSFVSTLIGDAGEAGEGRLQHNRSFVLTAPSGAPVSHRIRARAGANEIEASLTAPAASDAVWQFDFRGTAGFVPGSIEVRSGEVVGSDAHSVVFRLRAGTTGPIRLTYRLAR